MKRQDSILTAVCAPAVVLLVLAGGANDLRATDYSWANPAGGLFTDPANWNPSDPLGPPGEEDNALFMTVGAYSVNFTEPVTNHWLGASFSAVTFISTGGPHMYELEAAMISNSAQLFLGDGVNSLNMDIDTAVYVQDGGQLDILNSQLNSQYAFIAQGAPLAGTVRVDGGTWTNDQLLNVGADGNGTLEITNGGEVNCQDAYIADQGGSTGLATVSGGVWTNSGYLRVGSGGDGALNVAGGGQVSNQSGYIALNLGSTGLASIQDAGSSWTNTTGLYIGGSESTAGGTGKLNVTGGSVDVTGTLKLWSGGSLNLSGGQVTTTSFDNSAGGTFSFTGGTLTVDGGTFTHNSGSLTLNGAGNPTVNLDNGATLSLANDIIVGNSQTATLNVNSGAQISSDDDGHIAYGIDSTGTVTVDGGTWSDTRLLFVGMYGDGVLNINNSGQVHCGYCVIAKEAGSTGAVTVDNGAWINDSEVYVGTEGDGALHISNGGQVSNATIGRIAYGAGSTGEVTVNDGTWTVDGQLTVGFAGDGALHITNGGQVSNALSGYIASDHTSTSEVTVNDGTWTVGGQLIVGYAGDSTLRISNGGQVSNTLGYVAYDGPSTVEVTVDNGTWTLSSNLEVGRDGDAALHISNGGQVSNNRGQIAFGASSTSEVSVADAGSSWTNATSLNVGGGPSGAGGTGLLTIGQGGLVSVGQDMRIWTGGTVNINGGTIRFTKAKPVIENSGTVNFSAGTVEFDCDVAIGAGGSSMPDFFGASPEISVGRQLVVTGEMQLPGTLTLSGGMLFAGDLGVTGTLDFQSGILELMGGDITMDAVLVIPSNGTLRGSGTVYPPVTGLGGSSIEAAGGLALGDATRYDGFAHEGALSAGSHTVTLNAKGFAGLGIVTELDGGTLTAANGVIVGMGDNLVGFGAVSGKLAAGFGSTIEATGDLAIGDATAFDGFVSDGVLVVADNTVTVNDANQAVLGSLTQLGAGTADGVLVADNGLVVEFGKNVIGRGTVDTPDDPLVPLTNNGAIIGDFPGAIELTGYVKGVGTLTNVLVTGTLSPGFSPVRLHAENLEIGDSGELVMELGGLSGGSEYDQLDVIGDLHLDGALQVVLIDDFVPGVGDSFDILDWDTLADAEFDTVDLPALVGRKAWNSSSLYSAGEISVIGMIPGDTDVDWDVDSTDYANFLAAFGGAGDWHTDFNEDGMVDLDDFALMRDYFGTVATPPAPAATPEPGTLLLLSLGGLAILRRCRA